MLRAKSTYEPVTEEQVVKEFDNDGEDVVRVKLDAGIYGDAHDRRYRIARIWLRGKDQSRQKEAERRRDALNTEHLRIAKSAKYAAVAAGIAALVCIVVTLACMWINFKSK